MSVIDEANGEVKMDILIKNIGGLPEDGELTLTITPKGQVILGGCIFTSNFGKEVKAVALPEHGDLIDRDELLTDLADRMCVDDMLDGIYQPAIDRINEAETIVEAT